MAELNNPPQEMVDLANLTNLPQELHFHIFLYLPYLEAHYAITSLYRSAECEDFWKQYLIQRFYVDSVNATKYRSLAHRSCRELCGSFTVSIKKLFAKRYFPKITYFNNLLVKYSEGKISEVDHDLRSSILRSDIIKYSGTAFIDYDDVRKFLIASNGLNESNRNDISTILKSLDADFAIKYIDLICQETIYFTPKRLLSLQYDIDIYHQFNKYIVFREHTEGQMYTLGFIREVVRELLRYYYNQTCRYVEGGIWGLRR